MRATETTNAKGTEMIETTFGKWTNGGNHVIVANFFDEENVRVENTVKSENRREVKILSNEEWLEMWDRMRDHGYSRG